MFRLKEFQTHHDHHHLWRHRPASRRERHYRDSLRGDSKRESGSLVRVTSRVTSRVRVRVGARG